MASDIPPQGPLAGDLDQPRTYFQETSDVPFVVVQTEQPEFDFPTTKAGEEQFARTMYTGEAGIEMGGFIRRLAFAWRFPDVNLLISGLIGGESKMLINTQIDQRVPPEYPGSIEGARGIQAASERLARELGESADNIDGVMAVLETLHVARYTRLKPVFMELRGERLRSVRYWQASPGFRWGMVLQW